ncbi:sigma 54-interacting transcriptional regulator [Fusibacter paucivorans]|uniref:Sigma 54-interacting transcriptional regulator n=1 Tax=Fusibacter paucivorans TaxID=76009 RepID=A0ABS5PNI2_9FIRM|nr:sigma 54-interacting transcriptional regulator [Fusibacter paucivorans]MBS7526733.1 sigma 54-interacting transcriptional regulator [Fusibacter paucivorans]
MRLEKDIQISISQIKQIFDRSFDGIFVTDSEGYVIFINHTAAHHLNRSVENTIGLNVNELMQMGIYDRSAALEAIKQKRTITMRVKTITGNSISTSLPIIENDKVLMTITNVRSEKTLDSYIKELEYERATAQRYRSAANYLSEVNKKSRLIIAKSKSMETIINTAQNIATTDCTVLISGESGTGKEVLSRFIHLNSTRSDEPFIPVNCAAIPHELIESEFFGYEKGAFTGANQQGKPGFFEMANNGTLFLDELGDMPISMQSKLLRALETGEIQRLGGTTRIKTNVRVITATNKNLHQLMTEGKFRDDLYYRISVIPFQLPPLRERPEDIVELSNHFLQEYNLKYNANKYFSDRSMLSLMDYAWPGNIRELRNIIERIFIITQGDQLEISKQMINHQHSRMTSASEYAELDLKNYMREVEKHYIYRALEKHEGRIGETADYLGIHRTLLYKKLKQFEELACESIDY